MVDEETDLCTQAGGFVEAHKEVLLSALRRTTASPTRLKLQEAHLIVALLRFVLPTVSDESIVRRAFY